MYLATHNSFAYKLEDVIAPYQDISDIFNSFMLSWIYKPLVLPNVRKWSLCQTLDIYEQLKLGVRYLDLRFVYRKEKKQFYTAHGLYGPSLIEIASQIKRFKNEVKSFTPVMIQLRLNGNEKVINDVAQEMIKQLELNEGDILKRDDNIDIKTSKFGFVVYEHHSIKFPYFALDRHIDSTWHNTIDINKLIERVNSHTSKIRKVNQLILTTDVNTIIKGVVNIFDTKRLRSVADCATLVIKNIEKFKFGLSDYIMLDFVDNTTIETLNKQIIN